MREIIFLNEKTASVKYAEKMHAQDRFDELPDDIKREYQKHAIGEYAGIQIASQKKQEEKLKNDIGSITSKPLLKRTGRERRRLKWDREQLNKRLPSRRSKTISDINAARAISAEQKGDVEAAERARGQAVTAYKNALIFAPKRKRNKLAEKHVDQTMRPW